MLNVCINTCLASLRRYFISIELFTQIFSRFPFINVSHLILFKVQFPKNKSKIIYFKIRNYTQNNKHSYHSQNAVLFAFCLVLFVASKLLSLPQIRCKESPLALRFCLLQTLVHIAPLSHHLRQNPLCGYSQKVGLGLWLYAVAILLVKC